MTAKQGRLDKLNLWLDTPPGRTLWRREWQCVSPLLSKIPAQQILHAGVKPALWPESSRGEITSVSFSPGEAKGTHVCVDGAALPFAASSFDLAYLPHCFDIWGRQTGEILTAVDKVLTSCGRVLVTGFNPWSLWGLWRSLGATSQLAPWCSDFCSRRQVARCLLPLSYVVQHSSSVYFSLPTPLAPSTAMEALGRVWCPHLGAVYVLLLQKRTIPLQPVQSGEFAAKPAMNLTANTMRKQGLSMTSSSKNQIR